MLLAVIVAHILAPSAFIAMLTSGTALLLPNERRASVTTPPSRGALPSLVFALIATSSKIVLEASIGLTDHIGLKSAGKIA